MAVIKHVAIKNLNYTAAAEYLTYKYDEYTNKPILDDQGCMIPHEEHLIEDINCAPKSYGLECALLSKHFGKNQSRDQSPSIHCQLRLHSAAPNGSRGGGQRQLGAANGSVGVALSIDLFSVALDLVIILH